MTKTKNKTQTKNTDGAAKRTVSPVRARLSSAASRRRAAIQPYWWILRGCRPDAS
jgi:hypothetical protein